MATNKYDIIVIGGGIAAYSTALYLLEMGLNPVLIDKTGGDGASGLPGGLANPAYGREAKKSWQAELCLQSLNEIAEKTGSDNPAPAILKTGIIRPASGVEQAGIFQTGLKKHDWQKGYLEWLDPGQMSELFPLVTADYGALWMPGGLTINVGRLVADIRNYLVSAGNEICDAGTIRVSEGDKYHTVCFDDREIKSPVVVFAPGPGIADYGQWSRLGFNRVKGQVIKAKLSETVDAGCSIAASGYAAFTGPDSVVIGSTYEHNFVDTAPSEETGRILLERFRRVCPSAAERICKTENWAGVRITTPDRKPCAGEHWQIRGFYCLAGMGSRGILTAPHTARLLAAHIVKCQQIPPEIDTYRYYRTRRFRNNSGIPAKNQ